MALLPGGFIATASNCPVPRLGGYAVNIWDCQGDVSGFHDRPSLVVAVPRKVHCFAVLADGRLAAADQEKVNVWTRYERSAGGLERSSFAHGYVPHHDQPEHIWQLVELSNGSLATTCAKYGVHLFLHDALYDGAAIRHTVEPVVCAGHARTASDPEYCFELVALPGGGFASGSWHATVRLWDRLGACRRTLDVDESVPYEKKTHVNKMLAFCARRLAGRGHRRARATVWRRRVPAMGVQGGRPFLLTGPAAERPATVPRLFACSLGTGTGRWPLHISRAQCGWQLRPRLAGCVA
eukprot:7177187-Prymnesium_polylepis.1